MRAFTTSTGKVLVLSQSNIDTDQIIPARFLTATDFDGVGEKLFHDWRFDEDGNPIDDHRLNHENARDCPKLVAGHNLDAVPHANMHLMLCWTSVFRVVISSQIADIFRNNSQNVGLLPVELEREQHDMLLEMDGEHITVDLEQCLVIATTPDGVEHRWPFTIDPFARHCLLNGLDRFEFLTQAEEAINAYEARQ